MAKAPAQRPQQKSNNAEQIKRNIAKLKALIQEIDAFVPFNTSADVDPKVNALEIRIERILGEVFGLISNDSHRYMEAASLDTAHRGLYSDTPMSRIIATIKSNQTRSNVLLNEAVRSLEERLADLEFEQPSTQAANHSSFAHENRRVFVVHGHDEAARESVARVLETLKFQPIILHEQSNQGRTLVEKFEVHSDAGFAVVLMTADDVGYSKSEPGKTRDRARQNVILELGFFVGKLGRDKVMVLLKGEIEFPSDYVGVAYDTLDDRQAWRLRLANELDAAGFDVDLNLLRRHP